MDFAPPAFFFFVYMLVKANPLTAVGWILGQIYVLEMKKCFKKPIVAFFFVMPGA